MKGFIDITLFCTGLLTCALHASTNERLVLIEGGAFISSHSNFSGKTIEVQDFYMGKFEITQREWYAIMGTRPSNFEGDDLPVEMVSWYDCIVYCNRRSLAEGLEPYYVIDTETRDPDNNNFHDDISWKVAIRSSANGYRLPTEIEWEYAASGGQLSQGFRYSGSEVADEVSWFWQNSGDTMLEGLWNWPLVEQNRGRTHPVGSKAPNELGLYDLSGNVREWCWDWLRDLDHPDRMPAGYTGGAVRVWKGGGWVGGDFCGEIAFRAGFEANSMGFDQGFRVARNP
jgi:formylglycine-generating enzyme